MSSDINGGFVLTELPSRNTAMREIYAINDVFVVPTSQHTDGPPHPQLQLLSAEWKTWALDESIRQPVGYAELAPPDGAGSWTAVSFLEGAMGQISPVARRDEPGRIPIDFSQALRPVVADVQASGFLSGLGQDRFLWSIPVAASANEHHRYLRWAVDWTGDQPSIAVGDGGPFKVHADLSDAIAWAGLSGDICSQHRTDAHQISGTVVSIYHPELGSIRSIDLTADGVNTFITEDGSIYTASNPDWDVPELTSPDGAPLPTTWSCVVEIAP